MWRLFTSAPCGLDINVNSPDSNRTPSCIANDPMLVHATKCPKHSFKATETLVKALDSICECIEAQDGITQRRFLFFRGLVGGARGGQQRYADDGGHRRAMKKHVALLLC